MPQDNPNNRLCWAVMTNGSRFYVLRWLDSKTGKQRQKSSRTTKRREADRLADELHNQLAAGRKPDDARMLWTDFCERFETEHLAGLSASSRCVFRSAKRRLIALCNPARLLDVDGDCLSQFTRLMREEGKPETTIACYLRALRVALRWAVHVPQLLASAPRISMPKTSGRSAIIRGRPLTKAEIPLLLAAVDSTADIPAAEREEWKEMLVGLHRSGLRISEACRLSWEPTGFSVDLTSRRPHFRILGDAEKGRRDRMLPLTPDFAKWLLKQPNRTGKVFRIASRYDWDHIRHQIAAVGVQSGIVMTTRKKPTKQDPHRIVTKYATAHDLRRTFGSRWARRVPPVVLQLLMRHQDIKTTLTYYVHLEADDIADSLWKRKPKRKRPPEIT